jgi:hypothetical protein
MKARVMPNALQLKGLCKNNSRTKGAIQTL